VYSIASILRNEDLGFWDDIENRCMESPLRRTEIPHFSWQTAESYDYDPLREELANICQNERPFEVHTSGLGIFPGERKILFLIIAKDRNLLDLHEMIWENTILYARQPNLLYSPDNWIPHISLNLEALTDHDFSCTVSELTSRPLNFTMRVEQMGLLFLTLDSSGLDTVYDLHAPSVKK
jgi:2'-5' RNA ligase